MTPAAGGAPSGPAADHCLNCFGALGTPRPRFCPDCGQETNLRPPTLSEFAQQFGGAVVSTEGALWRTLKLLVLRPGELTRQYLAGRRKHYVAPVRLYLTVSVLSLLLLRLTNVWAPDAPAPTATAEKKKGADVVIEIGDAKAAFKDGKFQCEVLPQWLCKRIERRLPAEPGAIARQGADINDRFMANLGPLMFVLLPTFALFTKLAYFNRRLRYTEHLVFALHLHAFWFVALAFAFGWLSALVWLWMAIYAVLAMKRVFGGRRLPLLLRTFAISVAYLVTLSLGLTALGLFAFLA